MNTQLEDILRQNLPTEESRRDVRESLLALDPAFERHFSALVAVPELGPDEASCRVLAVLLQLAAIQVADDIADEDATGLTQGERHAPGCVALLQLLSQACLGLTTISAAARWAALKDMLEVGATHQWELDVQVWDFERAQGAALGLNGAQHRAYYRLLLDGTCWADRAPALGETFGVVLHVAGDRASSDRRWQALERGCQQRLLEWATAKALELKTLGHPPTLQQLGRLRALLEARVAGAT